MKNISKPELCCRTRGWEDEGWKEKVGVGNSRRTGFFLRVLSHGGVLFPCQHVLVMVNDAQRCFPTSVKLPPFWFLKRKLTVPTPPQEKVSWNEYLL
jgi:hypothetical protein